MNGDGERVDFAAQRRALEEGTGKTWWRTFEELAGSAEFLALQQREFRDGAEHWHVEHPGIGGPGIEDGDSEQGDALSRRRFLQLAAASVALASAKPCSKVPEREIVPYVDAPEQIVPGRALWFATAVVRSGYALGVLAESHTGRPTKLEGNPRHPASLGATDVFTQAAVLDLYDPDRSRSVLHEGQIASWSRCVLAARGALAQQEGKRGAGLAILSGAVTSPTLAAQIRALLQRFPQARWHRFEPVLPDNAREGARLAFGRDVDTVCHFERARVVLALDGDFLSGVPGSVAYARGFAQARTPHGEPASMVRLYAVESSPSLTGVMADHRLMLRASEIEGFALALAQALGALPQAAGEAAAPPLTAEARRWIAPLRDDLLRARGQSVVFAGLAQPPFVHALAQAMNVHLGNVGQGVGQNVGQSVEHIEPVEADPIMHAPSLAELAAGMEAGTVEALFILDSNPAYTAAADLHFWERLARVPFSLHLGLHADETAARCRWHVPSAHELESWGDARGHDGTACIIQPLIAPLWGGKSAHELIAAVLGADAPSDWEVVRAYWREHAPAGDFETWWRGALRDGVVPGSRSAPVEAVLRRDALAQHARDAAAAAAASTASQAGLEVEFRPHPSVWDGRYANNAWLQELPDPITKLTWDNAALIAPRLAESLQLHDGDVVELELDGRKLEAPVWLQPAQADQLVTLHLGYGRARAGRVGDGQGFDAYLLRTTHAPWFRRGLVLRKTGRRSLLATNQDQFSDHGREPVRQGSLAAFRADKAFLQQHRQHPSLYPEREYPAHAWAMSIDLNTCIGCRACVIACQAENNIPVVGKEQVHKGRLMHWIRIDRYYGDHVDQPRVAFQPVPCMQCENAPCEYVCPVEATVHDHEGLNQMVYNRCIGTRYCSNNCPWKVRRFNFLQFTDTTTESLKLQRNPDVTVRDRGVMEKCTYCIQRIHGAKIEAQKQDRALRDGDVRTACQQVCPAGAIVFGDLHEPDSALQRAKQSPLDYVLLEELNTRPRTWYGARLHNRNPDLE